MGNVYGKSEILNSEILNSWKEIARYLNRGVRTAQRWERDLQLPVRRPRGKRRSAVLAIRREIDAWLRSCPQVALEGENEDVSGRLAPFSMHATSLSSLRWEAARNEFTL